MKVILGKNSGFCYGVNRAVEGTIKIAMQNKGEKIYCLGELVHNGQVIQSLENMGVEFVNDLNDVENKIIIRAHGVNKKIYEQAKEKNISVMDFTCLNVLKIHSIAEEYSKKDYFIFLVGIKNHPETIGNFSFCGENSYLIENLDELEEGVNTFKKSGKENALVLVQTTYNYDKFFEICNYLKSEICEKMNYELVVKNTICNATKIRQDETKEISKRVDIMIIIGGIKSSNTQKLFDIAQENCKKVFKVENENDLNDEILNQFNENDLVGIMAGASTPKQSIQNVYKFVENL